MIALAGFMRLLTPWFVQQWQGRVLNIHPSLLPAFPGLHTHQQALAYGVNLVGVPSFLLMKVWIREPLLIRQWLR